MATPRGSLKIFLGYAAGVGKTYQMLVEAQQLRRQGVDVVVGYFEPHGRAETIAQTEGLEIVPRRIYTYEADRGWEIWNQLTTLGALIQVPSFLLFVINIFISLKNGKVAGDDPWDAWTLEWATTSPPPSYNFETIPSVRSRRPLWDLKHPDDPDWKYE